MHHGELDLTSIESPLQLDNGTVVASIETDKGSASIRAVGTDCIMFRGRRTKWKDLPLEIQSSLLNDMSDAFSGEVSVDGLPRFELSVRDNDGNLVLLEALDCCGVSADGLRSALSEIVRAKL